MSRKLQLYSFGDVDRSGKVRWTARELDYDIEEQRVRFGEHAGAEYRELNPYAQIPTVVVDGQTWIESTAICIRLAEKHPEAGLIPGDLLRRSEFWQHLCLTANTLEMPVVCYFLGSRGVMDERWPELVGDAISERMRTFASSLPGTGYLCGDFSLADVCAGYVLRVGLQAGLLGYEGKLAGYMDRLRGRPAAVASRVFESLPG